MSTYIDDTVIATKTFYDHIQTRRLIFEILLTYNFTLKFEKCEFLKGEVKFLGFLLSIEGVKADPSRIEIIQNLEEPKNQNHLQQIFGICNYYSRFVAMHNNYINPYCIKSPIIK